MNRLRWLIAGAPLAAGTALFFLYPLLFSRPLLVYVQFELRLLIFGIGAGTSLVIGLMMFLRQRGERIRAEINQQSIQDRRRFIQRLDHELKNPLTAILAGLANLAQTSLPSSQETTVSSIQNQVNRVRRLISDLRKLSDLEARPLDRTPIAMGDLLEEAFSITRDDPATAQRTLSLSLPRAPWPLPTITGDRDLLILAVYNLLNNAIKFTGLGDTIEMRAFEDGNHVVIEVADTGPGILEKDIPYIWDELYRGESGQGIPGSGLGLALTRSIISRHQGKIQVRSRPGEGTIFSMRLPV